MGTGADPDGWVYSTEQFQRFNQVPKERMAGLASMHLMGDAIHWYRWIKKTMGTISWAQFSHTLHARFRPPESEESSGALTKLRQTSSVQEYQTQFEQLINRNMQLPEPFLAGCFISCLRDDIRLGVKMSQHVTLAHAYQLATLHEESVVIHRRNMQPQPPRAATLLPTTSSRSASKDIETLQKS